MNLLPTKIEEVTQKEKVEIKLGKTYKFDFEKGEFVRDCDGKIILLDEFEAYIQWCEKAMLTARYKFLAYPTSYGIEFKDLIGSDLDNQALELEIQRMTKEALMVHPLTKSVDNFVFNWKGRDVYFEYEVTTTYDESKVLSSKVTVG